MRRAQSLDFNQNSSSSMSQQNKKVSLPMQYESDFAPKSSYSWLRRSAPPSNVRNTVLPVALVQEEVPNYFESTMQSMCLAFFTLAYTELIDGAVFSGQAMIVHALLKFLTILCIGIALIAAFASIRVFILAASVSETNGKSLNAEASKIYSALARIGSISVAVSCAVIMCLFAAVSLYATFSGQTA